MQGMQGMLHWVASVPARECASTLHVSGFPTFGPTFCVTHVV